MNKAGTMVLPFFVLYLTREKGFSAAEAGFFVLLYGAGSLVASPLAGRLADRLGPIVIMRASLLLSGAILLVFPFARGGIAIGAMTLVLSMTAESFRPANMTIFGDLVAPGMRKASFAVNRLAVNLGMSIGPALGGLLATLSFRWLFLVDGITSLAAGSILVLAAFPPHRRTGESGPVGDALADLAFGGGAHRDRRLLLFLAAFFPVMFVFFQHISSMPLFLVQNLGLSAAVYGLLFTVNTLMIVAIEVPVNLATAAWPHRRTLSLGALLCGLGFGSLAFAWNVWSVAATVVVWTFGEMLLFPGMADYLTSIAPARRRGEYMGLAQMTMGLAFTVGPWGGLHLLGRFGGRTLWLTMLAFGVASSAMLAVVVSNRANGPAPSISPSGVPES
ncbi:MAG: MFS transporter [Acidobacteria bacterium]|nr:MFS transporter [Acidobacteriota bacterium]